MTHDVFISYARADRDKARQLAEALRGAGRSVWWDRQIAPGHDFERTIEAALDRSRCVVVLWSVASVGSDWVRAEAMEALDRKALIPVLIERARVPLGFRTLNAIDLTGWPDGHEPDEYARLTETIAVNLGEAPPPAVEGEAPPQRVMPSVAVLPLMTMAGKGADETLSAGVTSEVISSLSHLPGFFVIAFGSAWRYRSRDVDARQVGIELGVTYVVQGTLQSSGGTLRVNIELVEAHTAKQLWSDTFELERTLEDIFAVQAAIAEGIAGRLQPRLLAAERLKSQAKPTETLKAWELVNRARPLYLTRDNQVEGVNLLRRAIELDPGYAEAHAQLAVYQSFMPEMRDPSYAEEARLEIEKALAIDPNNDQALLAAGLSYAQLGDWPKAAFHCERAVRANPNLAQGWANWALATLGADKDAEGALTKLDRALLLSPQDEQTYVWYHFKGACYAELGDFERAAEMTQLSVNHYGGFFFTWLCHAQHLAAIGDHAAARDAWGRAAALYPSLSFDMYRAALKVSPLSEHVNERLLESMTEAGLAE